jgi:hypothetical protein
VSYKEQFWALVDVRDAVYCWNWQGRTDAYGYGLYKGQRAHRVSLSLSGIPLDARLDVNHQCGNKSCCSPFHLQLMTHSDHSRFTRSAA